MDQQNGQCSPKSSPTPAHPPSSSSSSSSSPSATAHITSNTIASNTGITPHVSGIVQNSIVLVKEDDATEMAPQQQ